MEHIPDPLEYYGKCHCPCKCDAAFGPRSRPYSQHVLCEECMEGLCSAGTEGNKDAEN